MYVVVRAPAPAPLVGTALIWPLSLVLSGRKRKRNQDSFPSYLKLTTFSVWPLRLVHVHVLGVDHVARLLLLSAARRTPACSGARRTGLPRGSSLRGLVQLFGDLVQRPLDVFRRCPQPRHAAFVDGLLRVFDGLFGLFHLRFRDLLAVFAEHLLRLVEDAVQAVARLDLLHAAPVVFAVRFGLRLHLLGLFLGQAARGGDGDLLFLVGGLVFR